MTDPRLEAATIVARYRQLAAERAVAEQAAADAAARVGAAETLLGQMSTVEQFFHTVADERRALLESRVGALVDHGLRAVFGAQYRFTVRSELTGGGRGKQIKTRFYVTEQGPDGTPLELNVVDAAGGGIADVVSFLLRVVMLVLRQPAQRRLLILDEPFKFVSTAHFPNLTALIRELSTALDLQLVLVTHRVELMDAATQVVHVEKVEGASVARVEWLA